MASIVCSTQPIFTGFRTLFNKPVAPQLPITPSLGATRTHQQRHSTHPGAVGLDSSDFNPRAVFNSFVHPDVPAERKNSPKSAVTTPVVVVKPEEDEGNFQTKLGKPRFRSALEQVSYLTNESAMMKFSDA